MDTSVVQPKPRLCLSFDIEATGSSPYSGSLVMLGICAVLENTIVRDHMQESDWIVDKREWSIEETTERDPRCWEEFWMKNLSVWDHISKNAIPADVAIGELSNWLKKLSADYDLFWVARPSSFDWQWLNFYYDKYKPHDAHPLGFKAECINGYRDVWKLSGKPMKQFTDYTESSTALTHHAVDDARDQALVYLKSRQFWKMYFNPSLKGHAWLQNDESVENAKKQFGMLSQ